MEEAQEMLEKEPLSKKKYLCKLIEDAEKRTTFKQKNLCKIIEIDYL
jgi:hypothetical protein